MSVTGTISNDVLRYQQARSTLESSKSELEELQASEAVGVFQKQLALLQKRLVNDPASLRNMFIADGTSAIVWEFQQPELGEAFINTLWNLLARGDDMSIILQRLIWALPLKFKRKFIKAIDVHLRGRYPMFENLSEGWPGDAFIPPYIRPAEQRAIDFDLVNQGYLGYQSIGYSLRECELFVWLEVMRDKQCDDKPCELGVLIHGKTEPKGGCPVKSSNARQPSA